MFCLDSLNVFRMNKSHFPVSKGVVVNLDLVIVIFFAEKTENGTVYTGTK